MTFNSSSVDFTPNQMRYINIEMSSLDRLFRGFLIFTNGNNITHL
jgi:hypothetical protein